MTSAPHPPGPPAPAVVQALGVARLVYHAIVGSTMDEVHALAEGGAPAGTVVLAAAQQTARGRGGRAWQSEPDAGLWLTLLERPADVRALDVLALRVGLHLAQALDAVVDAPVGLKWPNDLLVAGGKLAGILIEVRWRDGRPEWVAIGVGINRRVPPDYPGAASVRADVSRDDLLVRVVPAVRAAATRTGPLNEAECEAWTARDIAIGRHCREPLPGTVQGIAANGALRVLDHTGRVHALHSGSLTFSD